MKKYFLFILIVELVISKRNKRKIQNGHNTKKQNFARNYFVVLFNFASV